MRPRRATCSECTTPGGIPITKGGALYSHLRVEPCPGSGRAPTETGACSECTHPSLPVVVGQGVLQDHGWSVKCPGSGEPPTEAVVSEPTAREQLAWLKPWDWSEEDITTRLDAYRDEVALDLGRDLLRDGLDVFLRRLVGPENAAQVLAAVRREDAAAVKIEDEAPFTVTADGERCPRQGCRIRSAHGHGAGTL